MAFSGTDPQLSAYTSALQVNKKLQPGSIDWVYTQTTLAALQKPEMFGPVLQRFGEGFSYTDFLLLNGSVNQITGRTNNYVYYELPKAAPLIPSAAISVQGSVGSFTVSVDSSASYLPRQFETFFIPSKYVSEGSTPATSMAPKQAQILTVALSSGTTYTLTCRFLDSTAYITTQVPASIKLMVGAILNAAGGNSPGGLIPQIDRSTFGVSIFKEANQIEGGASGQTYLFGMDMAAKSAMDMQWRMRKKMGIHMFAGEANTNTSVTQNDINGIAKPVLSADGLVRTMTKGSNWHFTNGNIDFSWFNTIRQIAEANGVTAVNYSFLLGSNLFANMQQGLMDWLKTQGSKTDYTTPIGEGIKQLGFRVETINIQNMQFACTVLRELSDPLTFGTDSAWGNWGVIIPDQEVTVNQVNGVLGTAKFKNLNFCPLNDAGVLRSNIVCKYVGTTGRYELVGTDYDMEKTIMVTEAAHPILLENQIIGVRPIGD